MSGDGYRRIRLAGDSATNTTWAVLALLLLSGCGSTNGEEDVLSTGVTSEALGTVKWNGATLTNQHLSTRGSETVLSTFHPTTSDVTMSFNNEDPTLTTNTPANRWIYPGASMMGWTTWHPSGSIVATGRVLPPSNWKVLWGNPAITRNRADPNKVYIANIAVNANKFPSNPAAIVGSINPTDASNNSTLPAWMCGSYLGGGCVSRSVDNGRSFTLNNNDCLIRASTECPYGTFYDGGSMTTSFDGRVYVAFNDVHRGRHDVYMAANATAPFQKITDFPEPVYLHPRIKYWYNEFWDQGDGALFMIYVKNPSGEIGFARYNGGASTTGSWTIGTWKTPPPRNSWSPVEMPGPDDNGSMTTYKIRTQPDYDFDVGLNEATQTEIRIVWTVEDTVGTLKHIQGASCTVGGLPSIAAPPLPQPMECTVQPNWITKPYFPGSNQWEPSIAYGKSPNGAVNWQISFLNNYPDWNSVELWRSRISKDETTGSYIGPLYKQEISQKSWPTKPLNGGAGYWGDYDTMVPGPSGGTFYRGFTDSTHMVAGSSFRYPFLSSPTYAAISGWVAPNP